MSEKFEFKPKNEVENKEKNEERIEELRNELREIRSRVLEAIKNEDKEELSKINSHFLPLVEVDDGAIDLFSEEDFILWDDIKKTEEMTEKKYKEFSDRIGILVREMPSLEDEYNAKEAYKKVSQGLRSVILSELTKRRIESIKKEDGSEKIAA